MGVYEHVREFAGMPVLAYEPDKGIVRPETTCQRIGRTFQYGNPQGEIAFHALRDRFLAAPACRRAAGIVIGPWWDDAYGGQPTSDRVIAALVAASDRLANLR